VHQIEARNAEAAAEWLRGTFAQDA
jgi:hypothetical protein